MAWTPPGASAPRLGRHSFRAHATQELDRLHALRLATARPPVAPTPAEPTRTELAHATNDTELAEAYHQAEQAYSLAELAAPEEHAAHVQELHEARASADQRHELRRLEIKAGAA